MEEDRKKEESETQSSSPLATALCSAIRWEVQRKDRLKGWDTWVIYDEERHAREECDPEINGRLEGHRDSCSWASWAKHQRDTNTEYEKSESLPDEPCSAFEVGKHDLQFECDWAVFPKGSGSSVCYATSEERARLIAAALNRFQASGEMDEFFKQNG